MRSFKLFTVAFTIATMIYMFYIPSTSFKKESPKRSVEQLDLIEYNKLDLIDESESDLNSTLDLIEQIEPIDRNRSDEVVEKTTIVFDFLEAEARSDAEKKIVLTDGVIKGVNFHELFCRAKAFSKGEFMPRAFKENFYRFNKAEFEHSGGSYSSLTIRSNSFLFQSDLIDDNKRSKAYLSMTKMFKNSCGLDESYLKVTLPLWCQNRGGELSCALDLKELIEILSGVEAKATKVEFKEEIKKLKEEISTSREQLIKDIEERDLEQLRKEFKGRVKQKSNIEEIDLRELFVP